MFWPGALGPLPTPPQYVGIGRRDEIEIEITPEMVAAGMEALESELLQEYMISGFREDLVRHVYTVMARKASGLEFAEPEPLIHP